MPIKTLDEELCNGCKICVDVCPEDVLRMRDEDRKAQIRYPQDCVACLLCEYFCPVKAIEVTVDKARPVPPAYAGLL
ncbi:MAG: 4Fe-4S binding protein [Chloroflexi bacterium]|nr:4Fe-4S binding protein [Chloroflexota bacterium]